MKTALIVMVLAIGGSAHAKGKKADKPKDPPVTILDMSGPDKPDPEFPEITKKGKL